MRMNLTMTAIEWEDCSLSMGMLLFSCVGWAARSVWEMEDGFQFK